jgi:hypothetical protein
MLFQNIDDISKDELIIIPAIAKLSSIFDIAIIIYIKDESIKTLLSIVMDIRDRIM